MTEEDAVQAAELAFGLLAGEEQGAAELRAETDPDFRAEVTLWQERAARLVDGPGEAPRPSVWPLIEARLPANDPATVTRPMASGGWRAAAIAATLVAGVMSVVAFESRRPAAVVAPLPQPPLVAMLSGADGKGVVAIQFDAARHRLTSSALAFNPGRHSAELWVIPSDRKPRSLGLVDAARPRSRVSGGGAAPWIAPGVTLAITIEPVGGSPTGKPTGPVVLSGVVQKS